MYVIVERGETERDENTTVHKHDSVPVSTKDTMWGVRSTILTLPFWFPVLPTWYVFFRIQTATTIARTYLWRVLLVTTERNRVGPRNKSAVLMLGLDLEEILSAKIAFWTYQDRIYEVQPFGVLISDIFFGIYAPLYTSAVLSSSPPWRNE